ncbi:hypothetical protein [Vibrio splendidus]|uniref:Uncharacterized protein n=1 Tax=Vibrio splendidus TaxID=29497 RepID=A0A2T5EJQ3_VIBSP|nr:hypothetical protein [Vibrio splendidus]EHY9845528.1 hypothetical protein [Vibrio cholerae]OEE49970.1 hypothetical protein A147_08915 [Vibrio splendidus FF-6]PTP20478.1 hypothetical protein CWO36_08095 [Vibrio splendidus]
MMRKNVTNFILMVVRVSEIKDIVILALDKREMIFPFHVDGFQVANGNRGKIKKQYRNATVFFHDGTTQKINDVVIKGAWGKSFLGKVFSFLNSSWRVEIVSEKIDMELQEQKNMIVNSLKVDQERVEPFFVLTGDFEQVENKINEAKSMPEIYKALDISEGMEVLDVL